LVHQQGFSISPAEAISRLAGDAEVRMRGAVTRNPNTQVKDLLMNVAGLSAEDRHQLDEQLTGLSRYVAVLAASASDRRQQLLNTVGFGIGIMSLVFTSVAVMYLTSANKSEWGAIGVAWLAVALVIGLVFIMYVRSVKRDHR